MEKVNKILDQKSIRNTPMRQLLLEHFLQEDKILGLLELRQAFPKADRITIYRTLKTFEGKGIIHRINSGSGEVKYGLCKSECTSVSHIDQHPHFHCRKCKKLECLDSVVIPGLHLPQGYIFEEVDMNITGICKHCV